MLNYEGRISQDSGGDGWWCCCSRTGSISTIPRSLNAKGEIISSACCSCLGLVALALAASAMCFRDFLPATILRCSDWSS